MGIPSLDELFTPQTDASVQASARQVAGQVGLPESAWLEETIGVQMVAILSALVASATSRPSTQCAAGGMLDYAGDGWRELNGSQVYDTPPIEATRGTCGCRLTNTSQIPYTFALDELRALNPKTGATYLNTTGDTLAAWDGVGAAPTLDLQFIAEQPGSASSSAVGAINELVTPLAGVTIVNTTPAVGTDAERAPAYVQRCREAPARLSPNGPQDAYSYFAKSTVRPDGTNCGVTKVAIQQPRDRPGVVRVLLASDAGAVAPDDVERVRLNLIANCCPRGLLPVEVASAEAVGVDLAAYIYTRKGSTTPPSDIQAAVLASLQSYSRALPIGGAVLVPGAAGVVFLDMMKAAIVAAAPGQILDVDVTTHTADVELEAGQVAVLLSSADSFTIRVAA